jgi:hypothetical protein
VPLAGLAARHTLDSLAALLAAPTPPMPLVELSAAERRDLAAYLLRADPLGAVSGPGLSNPVSMDGADTR